VGCEADSNYRSRVLELSVGGRAPQAPRQQRAAACRPLFALVSTGGSHFGSDQDPSGTIWGSTVIVYQMIDPF
jgi:hypothetical protein